MKKFALIIPALAMVAMAPQAVLAKASGITMAQARAIALKAAPGKIEKAEREREGGGERYSFDIRQETGSTRSAWMSEPVGSSKTNSNR